MATMFGRGSASSRAVEDLVSKEGRVDVRTCNPEQNWRLSVWSEKLFLPSNQVGAVCATCPSVVGTASGNTSNVGAYYCRRKVWRKPAARRAHGAQSQEYCCTTDSGDANRSRDIYRTFPPQIVPAITDAKIEPASQKQRVRPVASKRTLEGLLRTSHTLPHFHGSRWCL